MESKARMWRSTETPLRGLRKAGCVLHRGIWCGPCGALSRPAQEDGAARRPYPSQQLLRVEGDAVAFAIEDDGAEAVGADGMLRLQDFAAGAFHRADGVVETAFGVKIDERAV